jgi:hypothetical protein
MPEHGTRPCVLCGGDVSIRNGPGRPPDYCSPTCRDEGRRRRQQTARSRRFALAHAVPAPRRPPDPWCEVGLLRSACTGTPATHVIVDGRRRLACRRCRYFLGRIGKTTLSPPTASVGPPRHAAGPGPESRQPSEYVGKHFDALVVKVDGFVIGALNRMGPEDVLESQFVAELRTQLRERSTPQDKADRQGVSRIVLLIHGRNRLRAWVVNLLTEHLGGYRLEQVNIGHRSPP